VLCSTLRLVGARPAAPRLAGIGRLRETANQIVNRQARYNYVQPYPGTGTRFLYLT
jgi:hypothetical protein